MIIIKILNTDKILQKIIAKKYIMVKEIYNMNNNSKYNSYYSEESFFNKIKVVFSKAGVSVVYGALLLFYALKDPNVPMKAKATIISALGYFISPIDLIADPVPVVGYGDDLTAIISVFITPKIRNKARDKTKEWFGNVDEEDFSQIDNKL